MPFGVSFAPTAQAATELAAERPTSPTTSRAIQLLSLRLPRRIEGPSIAPPALLAGAGSAGLPGGGGLSPGAIERLLRLLLGAGQGQLSPEDLSRAFAELSGRPVESGQFGPPGPTLPPAPTMPKPSIQFAPPGPTLPPAPSPRFMDQLQGEAAF